MPAGSEIVRLRGQTGGRRRGVKNGANDPKLTLIVGRPAGTVAAEPFWPFEMTVARPPLASEFSGITVYGAGSVLPTNFVQRTIVHVEPGRLAWQSSAFLLQ